MIVFLKIEHAAKRDLGADELFVTKKVRFMIPECLAGWELERNDETLVGFSAVELARLSLINRLETNEFTFLGTAGTRGDFYITYAFRFPDEKPFDTILRHLGFSQS